MSHSRLESVEAFKKALIHSTRALANADDLEIVFGPDGPRLDGQKLILPPIPRDLNEQASQILRGVADREALKIAYHDAATHARARPKNIKSAEAFDALEAARIDAIGAKLMGVRHNLNAANRANLEKSGIAHKPDKDSVRFGDILGQIARESLTKVAVPGFLQRVINFFRGEIESKCKESLLALSDDVLDQEAYANQARAILRDLGLEDDSDLAREEAKGASEEEAPTPENEGPNEDDDGADEADPGENELEEAASDDAAQTQSDTESATQAADSEASLMAGDESAGDTDHVAQANAEPSQTEARKSDSYQVFTRAFDETIAAEALCEPDELDRLRGYLNAQLAPMASIVSRLANRLQRKLLAQQNRSWHFDLEEGVLDASKLMRVIVDPSAPLSFKQESDTAFRDTVVTLLIDNSGSMRGRPIMVAAVCADILARTLERCGVKVEILGFTTKTWKGGQSRDVWVKAGKPANPGRLNDLRHIIYKSADSPWRRTHKNLGLMMREGLLKENIDGEALEWAHGRLLQRHEARKILMVISDGAPVDDSTLGVNTGHYLETHLRQVIHNIEARGAIELCAIGIGHDVTRYYARALTLIDVEHLASGLMDKLGELFGAA